MTNDDIEKLGFSSDNPYYSALRESQLPAGISPAEAAREMISDLMAPKDRRQKPAQDDYCFVIVHWSDAASLLLEEPCKMNRDTAAGRLKEKYDGMKFILKYRRLAQLPEFMVCDIGSEIVIGQCALPLRKQIKTFSSLKDLNAYLPQRAPRLVFDRSSIEASTYIDANHSRNQQQNVLKRSKALTALFADIGEDPLKCLFQVKASGVGWTGHSSQPCDLAAVQLMVAAFNYYCVFIEQRKLFQHG